MPLITITQNIGSDGISVARRVAAVLRIPLYDDAKLMEEAIRMGLDIEQLQGLQEKAPGWFDRLIGEKFDIFSNLMGSVIYEAARRGEGVIIGHGSQVLLQDFSCAMHVLVVSSEERRISNLMKQMDLSREGAEKLIRKNDQENEGFFRYVFRKDWDDPALYDVCLNPGKIGIERATQTILEMVKFPELKACNIYAVDALDRFSKTKRIEAPLLEQGFQFTGLRVEMPEKGFVQLSGIVENHVNKDSIAEVIKLIPGVERVDMDMLMVLPVSYD